MSELPVVVVGAGPVGLAAAAALRERGVSVLVLEQGASAGAAVREWNHVRMFSPWGEVIDPTAARLLAPTGWEAPNPKRYPTGLDWATGYLQPLADALGDAVRYNTRVTGVARRGRDRVVDAGRADEPFTVHIETADLADGSRREERLLARAIIDSSGTWGGPNPLGSEGLPAIGERGAAARICYRVPNTEDPAVRKALAGKHIVIAGSGHSALTAIIALTDFAKNEAGTRITWAIRRGTGATLFGGGAADELPARGALGLRARQAVDEGLASVVTGFRTQAVRVAENAATGSGPLTLIGDDEARIDNVDYVVALTGFRPDLSWLTEIRLALDATLQAPVALAPLIDPNVHSCGTVYPHGVAELAHPEPGFYLAGMKSYGRAPTFLAMTGYEQVRSIAAELAGDHEAAARVELSLPDTGVCGGSGDFGDADAEAGGAGADGGGGCCSVPQPVQPELVPLGIRPTR